MSSNPLRIDDKHAHCKECGKVFDLAELRATGLCVGCSSDKARKHLEKKHMEKSKAIFQATKQLADQIAAARKGTAISPEFFDELSKELGGAKGIGQTIAKDIKRLHGEGLSAAEQKYFTYDDKTIQRYWQSLMQFMQQQDKANAVDVSSLSDKELQATLLTLAQNLIAEDETFRRRVIELAIKNDKSFVEEILNGPEEIIEGEIVAEQPKIESAPASVHFSDEYEVEVIQPEGDE